MASTPPPALPLEILLLIAGHLSVATLSSFSRTCHSLHELLTPRLDSVFAAESTSILQWAAKRNLPATVERALIHVPHVPTNRWICTPWGLSYLLVNAVRKRQTEIVRVLLAHGIDPNRGIGESMPLVMAAHKRDMVIVRMLLEAGADVKKRCRRHGHTALNAAVFLEDQEMVDLMLKYSGAN